MTLKKSLTTMKLVMLVQRAQIMVLLEKKPKTKQPALSFASYMLSHQMKKDPLTYISYINSFPKHFPPPALY